MEIKYRSKVLRSLTPEGLKHLLSWSNQKAQVLDVLRQITHTEEFFGPKHRINTKVRIPETWTEMREALRNLTSKRNYGIALIYRGKCRKCGGRFNATSPRKHYCSNECEKKADYKNRLDKGDYKKGMVRTRQRKHQAVYDSVVKQEQIREKNQKIKAESLYQEVVFGKFDKRIPFQYYDIYGQLGNGNEARGHNKIVGWYQKKLKFAQIPAEDQKIFITWIK